MLSASDDEHPPVGEDKGIESCSPPDSWGFELSLLQDLAKPVEFSVIDQIVPEMCQLGLVFAAMREGDGCTYCCATCRPR